MSFFSFLSFFRLLLNRKDIFERFGFVPRGGIASEVEAPLPD